jgi:hypothetical protein
VLANWCQGYGIPYSSMEEPWVWIIAALPNGPEEPAARSALAIGAAALIRDLLDGKEFGSRTPQLWYNLLKLCAELNSPDELSAGLQQALNHGVPGEYDGVPLHHILLHAVGNNQIDTRLQSLWASLLENPGDTPRYLGFNGSLMMPASDIPSGRGRPNRPAIGVALKFMANALEGVRSKMPDFRSLLDEALETYPGWDTFDKDILDLAHRYGWPEWAVECAPCLFILTGPGNALVWNRMVASIPQKLHFDIRRELCNGVVLEIRLNGAYDFVSKFAPIVERYRKSEFTSGSGAMQGAVVDSLMQAKRENVVDARLIEEAHFQFLHAADLVLV